MKNNFKFGDKGIWHKPVPQKDGSVKIKDVPVVVLEQTKDTLLDIYILDKKAPNLTYRTATIFPSDFTLEAQHDNEERKIIEIRLRKIADKLITTLGSMPAEQADQIVFNIAYLIYTKMLGLKGKIKKTMDATARIGSKCIDMGTYEFVEDKK